MKRAAILLTLTALLAFAPSAFACWKCNTTDGCVGTDVGVPGWNDCFFDGTACHRIGGFCQGFAAQAPLAASYSVAAVRVVASESEKAPDLTAGSSQALPEPQKAGMAAIGR